MSGVASAVAGAGLVGTAVAANSAKKAGKQQANSANAATAEQQRQFDLINEQNAPYRQAGSQALNQLMGLYGLNGAEGGAPGQPDYSAFMNSPDYQFAQQQGEQSLLRNRAALGGLQGGQTGAALQQYGQGLASQQLGNYRNSLMGLVGAGQQATQFTGQAGFNTGQGISQNLQNAGNAQAAGTLTAGNAMVGGIGSLGQAAQNYFQGRKVAPPGVGADAWVRQTYGGG